MKQIITIIFLAALLVGCAKKKEAQPSNQPETSVSAADQQLLQKASDKMTEVFARSLRGALMAAMQEGGAVNAINVCSNKAPAIAREVSHDFWTIRRVSDRYRNPDNEADSHQLEILARFKDTTQGRPADYYEWSDQDGIKIFSFYKPIYTAPMCLNCHGPVDRIPPETMAAIQAKYPNDHATGFSVGDLRGMFVVQARWPEGKQAALEILAADSL